MACQCIVRAERVSAKNSRQRMFNMGASDHTTGTRGGTSRTCGPVAKLSPPERINLYEKFAPGSFFIYHVID